jgi:hypothetical protein
MAMLYEFGTNHNLNVDKSLALRKLQPFCRSILRVESKMLLDVVFDFRLRQNTCNTCQKQNTLSLFTRVSLYETYPP